MALCVMLGFHAIHSELNNAAMDIARTCTGAQSLDTALCLGH
jgi:hypothetical protein